MASDIPAGYEPMCNHDAAELRILIDARGVKQYKFQCMTCGSRGMPIKRTHPIVMALDCEPPFVDKDISNRYYAERAEQRKREYDESRDEESRAWWEQYTTYLDSDDWRAKASQVLIRDGLKCKARLDGCYGGATQVHHLTYKHVGDEPLFDLIAVCEFCHDRITAMDRNRRGRGE